MEWIDVNDIDVKIHIPKYVYGMVETHFGLIYKS
jgi:hypothetical protein